MSIHKNSNINEANIVLREMLDNYPSGVIQVEKRDKLNIVYATSKMYDLLGCTKEEFDKNYKNKINRLFTKELSKKIDDFFNDAHKKSTVVEDKILDFKGNEKWVSITCNKFCNQNKVSEGYLAFVDIDNIKRTSTSDSVIAENMTFRSLISSDADIMFEYDIMEDILTINTIGKDGVLNEKIVPYFADHVMNGKYVFDEDKEKFLRMVWLDDTTTEEFRYVSMDGSHIWCSIKAIAIKNDNNMNKKIIGWVKNINDRKKSNEYLEDMEKRDALTKLYNEEHAKIVVSNYLHNEITDMKNAFIIIDIDNFSDINDELGKVFGDAVLINIGAEIRNVVRKKDIVARIGGDKFLVFLKNIKEFKEVEHCIKRLQELVMNISLGDKSIEHLTCSIGVSISPEHGSTYDELLKNTDKALYFAKVYGRNRYEIYDENVMQYTKRDNLYNTYGESIDNSSIQKFEQDITTSVFEIISKTKDVKVGIRKILELIGRKYSATNVNIIEIRNKRFTITHNWSYNGIIHDMEYIALKFEKSFEEKYKAFFKDDILKANDTNEIKEKLNISWLIDKYRIKSLLQAPLKNNDEVFAVVSVIDTQETRKWNKSQCDTLKTISKLLSNYLLQFNESESIQSKLDEVKNFDSLTGLPLLDKFKVMANRIVKNNKEKKYVILNIDFVKFKYINDIVGYDKGNRIIKDFAKLIAKNKYQFVIGCRKFADTFLVLQEYESNKTTEMLIEEMTKDFSEKINKKYPGVKIAFAVGACVVEKNYGDIIGPIDNANAARKYAKEINTSVYFFDKEMKKRMQLEFEIVNSMENALLHSEFKVYYQPKVNISNGSIAGAEALVRWAKPDGTLLPPNQFIPLFEKNGFVVNLDYFVYEQVCKSIRNWMDKNMKVLPISVNVSRVHLFENENFINDITNLVDKYEIPHELIELELTENIFLDSTKIAINTMSELRNRGFLVSIDDFGSGYSSLNILKDVSSDILKLDKAFFSKDSLKKEEQIILASIVDMAKKLDIKVLSEGVETKEQSKFLKEIQCDLAQGFLFSKPIPIEDFEKMLNENKSFRV